MQACICHAVRQRKENGNNSTKKNKIRRSRVPKRLSPRPCRLPVFPPEVEPELEKKNSMLRFESKTLIRIIKQSIINTFY